jgi:hypothetical protein
VKLSENHVFHDKSKHIEIKYHYIRDMVQRKTIHVQHLSTHEQVVDVFTKPLVRTKFEYFHERLALVENASLKAAGERPPPPPPPPLEPTPKAHSEGERLGRALPERSPSGAFFGSALPLRKMCSLVFKGALRERPGSECSLDLHERSQRKKHSLKMLQQARAREEVIGSFLFLFFERNKARERYPRVR